MAIKPKDIYDGRKKRSHPVAAVVITIIALLVLAVAMFYWLRSRCLYDGDGNATIAFPFTEAAKTLKESKAQEQDDFVLAPPDISTDSAPASAESTDTPAEGTTAPDDGAAPGDDTAPDDGTLPADGAAPDGDAAPADGTLPADGTTPDDGAAPVQ